MCQFYQTLEDLVHTHVPFFKAGLENNEACIWILPDTLSPEAVKSAFHNAMPNFADYLYKDQIEFLPARQWYLRDGEFNKERLLKAWDDKLNSALSSGYAGLRVAGDGSWCKDVRWETAISYENVVGKGITDFPILAICSYPLDECSALQVAEMISHHEISLVSRAGHTELIGIKDDTGNRQSPKKDLDFMSVILDAAPCQVMVVNRQGLIVHANQACQDSFGLPSADVEGKYIWELGVRQNLVDAFCQQCVSEQFRVRMEHESEGPDGSRRLSQWSATTVPDTTGTTEYIIAVGIDITERKLAEEELRRKSEHNGKMAETLQKAMLPSISTPIKGFGIAGRYDPAVKTPEVGGDFYDVFKLPDGRIAFTIGDVSGKGVPAAVHTAMVKYMLRAYADTDSDPGKVLFKLNNAMYDYTSDEVFATLVYGLLDPAARTVTYTNAGHEKPLLYNSADEQVIPLDLTGRAIGVERDVKYDMHTLELSPGDFLLLYTDGITDARNADGFFDMEGLSRAVAANASHDEDIIAESVYAAALAHANGHLNDDAAILVVRASPEKS